jgi:hypothetical protein
LKQFYSIRVKKLKGEIEMKKLSYILGFIILTVTLSSCDLLNSIMSYRVTIHNADIDKYITSVYVKDFSYTGERWSKNYITDFIYPNEAHNIYIQSGTYDVRVILEDDNYSYDIVYDNVYIHSDMTLDVCIDCKAVTGKYKIIKTQKLNKK